MIVRDFLLQLVDRRLAARRDPTMVADLAQAERFIRETKYTGWYMTHCAEGVPKWIEFPNPERIDMRR